MRNDKHIALKMRQQGKSYKKIKKELGIPLSTLSEWFANLKWSQDLKNDLTRRANYVNHKGFRKYIKERQIMWEKWREQAREAARQEFPKLKKDPLFIAGIMLYWGEGDNKVGNSVVSLSNTNSNMLRLFVIFLKKICNIPLEKLQGQMILYPDLKEEECKHFWSQATGLPLNQFHKTQYIQGRHPTKRLSYGIFQIRLSSRQLKEKIIIWINLFHDQYPLLLAESKEIK